MSGLQNVKVLIVDPAGNSRRLLYGIFPLLEIRDIRSVDKVELAVVELHTYHRDVIFCDEETKDLHAFVKTLRAGRQGGVPVFLVAVEIHQDQILAARDCGITGVILKPVSAETLERKIRTALGLPKEGHEMRLGPADRRVEAIPTDFPDRRRGTDRRTELFPGGGK